MLLSYTYEPPTSGAADADLVRLNAVLGWRSFTARHARRRRDADGSGIAVTARTSAYDEDESTLEYDRTARLGRLRVAGALTHRTFDGVRQRVTDVRGEYTTAPTRYGQPSFAAGWSRRTGDAAPLDFAAQCNALLAATERARVRTSELWEKGDYTAILPELLAMGEALELGRDWTETAINKFGVVAVRELLAAA